MCFDNMLCVSAIYQNKQALFPKQRQSVCLYNVD